MTRKNRGSRMVVRRFFALFLCAAMLAPSVPSSASQGGVTSEDMQKAIAGSTDADPGDHADTAGADDVVIVSEDGTEVVPIAVEAVEEGAAGTARKAAARTASGLQADLGTGTGTQRETKLDGNRYFENDKYLSDPTGEHNGQNTYNLFLEQAVVDNDLTHMVMSAPDGANIFFILDRSTSMRHAGLVSTMNDSMAEMIARLKTFNDQRIADAKAGIYSDIDPNGNVEAQMKSHLISVSGVIGFNNEVHETYHVKDGTPITSDAAVATLSSKVRLEDSDSFFHMETRTDLAMQKALEWVRQETDPSKAYVVLLTDGIPTHLRNNYGWDHNFYYPDGGMIGSFSLENVNSSLASARDIKDLGATVYGYYIKSNSVSYSEDAEASGRIEDIDPYSVRGIASIFLSLLSSDYPKNGQMTHTGSTYADMRYTGFSYEPDDRNRCGNHYTIINGWDRIPEVLEGNLVSDIRADGEALDTTGYAGADSVLQDTISQPFSLFSSVRVYKVPRIPANLGANGVPTDRDGNGKVSSFRWGKFDLGTLDENGDRASEWMDITDDVRVRVNGQTVSVSGFDYEANALTAYDKDLANPWNSGHSNAAAYKPGDYGWKLVLQVPIQAEFTFGGNGIRTNHPTATQFLPGNPHPDTGLPVWPKNGSLNPSGNTYVTQYPVPEVDLNINYRIVSDSLKIYAPQTAGFLNLVTDELCNLFYVDPQYDSAKKDVEDAKKLYENAQTALALFNERNGSSMSAAQQAEFSELERSVDVTLRNYEAALQSLSLLECYIPDGINNQFVNIHYELRSPSGAVVGTMDVPHGKAYDGSNLTWTFSGSTVTESGTYTVNAAVTPANTAASPDGYVSSKTSDAEERAAYPYDSEQYSSTGSTAAGSQSAKTFSESPTAHIFQLKILAQDTRLMPNQTLDFHQGNEMLNSTDNPHILGYEWVCTDGKTKSVKSDEPGGTQEGGKVGGYPMLSNSIAAQARTDGRVVKIGTVDACGNADGSYVPVNVVVARSCGSLDKWLSIADQNRQSVVRFSDSDNLYGAGKSSVMWARECDYVSNCDAAEFADAQKYNAAETGIGKVHYLIHVQDNPNPKVEKSTSTPAIGKGEDIKWNVRVSNTDDSAGENPKHRTSDNMMVDILPYVGDTERIDPLTNHEGSKFSGELYFKSVVLNFEDAPSALRSLKAGNVKYTVDPMVRTATMSQLYGTAVGSTNVPWQNASFNVNGNSVTVSVPNTAKAIRVDTLLPFGEAWFADITANIKNPAQQVKGDYYHNQAHVYNHDTRRSSETVATLVSSKFIDGVVWVDEDANGLIGAGEEKLENITVSLYQLYNPKNGGSPDRTINGLSLSRVWSNETMEWVSPQVTDVGGAYMFDDLQTGTYYIVADHLPEGHSPTRQNAGTDAASRALDSKCDTGWVGNAADRTLWIKNVYLGNSSVRHQNFGVKPVLGSLKVYKSLDEIYYPLGMTDEEKADYQLVFTFQIRHTGTGAVYRQTVRLTPENFDSGECYCEFTDIPVGTYVLTEQTEAQYAVSSMTGRKGNVSWNAAAKAANVTITEAASEAEVLVRNRKTADPPGGDENGMKNRIKVRVPVKLELRYVGQDPISSKTLTKYTFTREDFDPARRGDMIVTYDDGTQISLSAGTLRFEDVQLEPGFVTNMQNSGDKKVAIAGYYSEKGRTVTDSFRVKVDLKPIHKFTITFHSNDGRFDCGTQHDVYFAYDDNAGRNVITKGVYRDTAVGGLTPPKAGWTFAGWNTSEDGSGVNKDYRSLADLNAIGQDPRISHMDLYAQWEFPIHFNATSGAVLSGGTGAAETALAGRQTGSLTWRYKRTATTGLTGSKNLYEFVYWNTSPDGRGTKLTDYGRVTGEITFYAVYFRGTYGYTGGVQEFTAPAAGIYEFQLWGAPSGELYGTAGKGSYVKCYVQLAAQQKIYVMVGGSGETMNGPGSTGGWNGGGYVHTCDAGVHASSGGGMTHISTTANVAYSSSDPKNRGSWNPAGTIAVAGGGGGVGLLKSSKKEENARGGNAGAESSANGFSRYNNNVILGSRNGGAYGAYGWQPGNYGNKDIDASGVRYTANTGESFVQGCGRSCYNSSSGGGGWYGGNSAAQVDRVCATKVTNGSHCAGTGVGGTSYISPAGRVSGYENRIVMLGGDIGASGGRPTKPNGDITPGGYVHVQLIRAL